MMALAYQDMDAETFAAHLDRNGYFAGADRIRNGEPIAAALRAEYADDSSPRFSDDESHAIAGYVRDVIANG